MAAPRSANGRLAVAAGYQPGTKEYRSFTRNLQRATTTATQRRAPRAETLSKLTGEQAAGILTRKATRDAGGQRGIVGKRIELRARIELGGSPYEQARAARPRAVVTKPLSPEQAAAVARGDLGEALALDFWGAPVGTDGNPVAVPEIVSIRIV